MKRFLGLLVVLFIGLGLAPAEQATVNHGVSLRGDPSTQNPPIGHLNRNTVVSLLAKRPRTGFYHVQLADGTKGWVGVHYLTVETAGGTQPTNPTNPTNPTDVTNLPSQHCAIQGGLPDSTCTPGVVRTTDLNVICHQTTKQFRPPSSYTTALKRKQIGFYAYPDTNLADYEEDHLISLELGGDGYDPKNLWPEPHTGNFNSFDKDKVENWLHKQVCAGSMDIKDAQKGIAENWKQYLPQMANNP
jgi:hypothetical protein